MTVDDTIRPFELKVEEAHVADLRDRLARVRLPERETVSAGDASSDADWGQGVPRAYLTELAEYWAT